MTKSVPPILIDVAPTHGNHSIDIEERRSTTRYNDISTVYAWLIDPIVTENERGTFTKKSDTFSCFSNDYKVGKEREFIYELNKTGKYTRYVITWSDSN
jgi:hypothetical protein